MGPSYQNLRRAGGRKLRPKGGTAGRAPTETLPSLLRGGSAMDDDTRSQEGSVSRRTVLKRIGAAGAVAWVTPVISSLTTPAHAAGVVSAPGAPCDTPGNCDNGFSQCGTCGDFESSSCYTNPAGAGFCAEDAFCAGLQTCAPGSCPPGYECAVGTACNCDLAGPGVCLKLCGSGQAPIKRAGIQSDGHGLTTTGKYV